MIWRETCIRQSGPEVNMSRIWGAVCDCGFAYYLNHCPHSVGVWLTDKCLALLKLTTDCKGCIWVVVKWILFPLCFFVPFKGISSGCTRCRSNFSTDAGFGEAWCENQKEWHMENHLKLSQPHRLKFSVWEQKCRSRWQNHSRLICEGDFRPMRTYDGVCEVIQQDMSEIETKRPPKYLLVWI